MFAWRKHRGNMEAVWEEILVPQPGPTELLVKMLASGGKARLII
jgi:propanol-preferring alcohol dehydrogenase